MYMAPGSLRPISGAREVAKPGSTAAGAAEGGDQPLSMSNVAVPRMRGGDSPGSRWPRDYQGS